MMLFTSTQKVLTGDFINSLKRFGDIVVCQIGSRNRAKQVMNDRKRGGKCMTKQSRVKNLNMHNHVRKIT